MGKGTYPGGSSIVQPGSDWFSYTAEYYRSWRGGKPKPEVGPDPAEEKFVRSHVRARLRSKVTPILPDPATALGYEIAQAESVYVWVANHPLYAEILKQERALVGEERRRTAMEA